MTRSTTSSTIFTAPHAAAAPAPAATATAMNMRIVPSLIMIISSFFVALSVVEGFSTTWSVCPKRTSKLSLRGGVLRRKRQIRRCPTPLPKDPCVSWPTHATPSKTQTEDSDEDHHRGRDIVDEGHDDATIMSADRLIQDYFDYWNGPRHHRRSVRWSSSSNSSTGGGVRGTGSRRRRGGGGDHRLMDDKGNARITTTTAVGAERQQQQPLGQDEENEEDLSVSEGIVGGDQHSARKPASAPELLHHQQGPSVALPLPTVPSTTITSNATKHLSHEDVSMHHGVSIRTAGVTTAATLDHSVPTALRITRSDVNHSRERQQTISSRIRPLLSLTRPANFPGIVLFHMLGVYLAMKSSWSSLVSPSVPPQDMMSAYWSMLLFQPSMWLTLVALMLTSATSMLVNDYYDAKLGRDNAATTVGVDKDNGEGMNKKPLVDGELSFRVVRRFTSYLYALALACQSMMPGSIPRLMVVFGLSSTYLYTQHLKPITWIKNVVCAGLIAISPLTSGSAALHLLRLQQTGSSGAVEGVGRMWSGARGSTATSSLSIASLIPMDLLRLVLGTFFGVFAREVVMDCTDVDDDRASGVKTIPVVRGRRYALAVAFFSSVIMATTALVGPVAHLVRLRRGGVGADQATSITTVHRRLGFASLASVIAVRGSWRIYRGQQAVSGNDDVDVEDAVTQQRESMDRFIRDAFLVLIFLLASYV